MPDLRICNYCGEITRQYRLQEAMDGGHYAVCMACDQSECVGCEYEDNNQQGVCTQAVCLVAETVKLQAANPTPEEGDEEPKKPGEYKWGGFAMIRGVI